MTAEEWARLLPAHRADRPGGTPQLLASLPLGDHALEVVADSHGRVYPVPKVRGEGRRARPGDGAAEALLALAPLSVDGFELTRWHHRPAYGERGFTVDQTNESVVVGEAAVVKWTVLAEPGPHPAPSLLSLLDDAGFTGMPRPWGALEWEGRLLALAVELVPGAVDGWTWAVEDIASLDLDRAADGGRAVGELVSRFHQALAGTARPATADEVAAWRTLGPAPGVPPAQADAVRAVLAALPAGVVPVQRVHGDLHVGQVLRSPEDLVLTDFDGNPVVPPAERLLPQPVELDVAGLAQSFTHAGLVVRRHHPELDPGRVEAVAAVARSAFLTAYGGVDQALLKAFSLRQVCREFTYAATHLPRWSYVPEAALPMLLESP